MKDITSTKMNESESKKALTKMSSPEIKKERSRQRERERAKDSNMVAGVEMAVDVMLCACSSCSSWCCAFRDHHMCWNIHHATAPQHRSAARTLPFAYSAHKMKSKMKSKIKLKMAMAMATVTVVQAMLLK